MGEVYFGLFIIVVVYLLYFILIISNKRRLNSYIKKSKETVLIGARYKINFDKVNHKLVANIFAITNASIIGITFMIIATIHNIILKLLVAFLVATSLIVVSYLKIGKYIKGKEGK
jgi:hypothetical protein